MIYRNTSIIIYVAVGKPLNNKVSWLNACVNEVFNSEPPHYCSHFHRWFIDIE